MNFEKPEEQEALPTKEAVLDVVAEHLKGLSFEIEKELSDESGIYQIEIMTTEPDAEGYIREYTYSRKSTRTGQDLKPKIYLAYFEDDMPVGGEDLYEF